MAVATDVVFTRAKNLQANLRRIFDRKTGWAVQSRVAKDAGMHPVNLNKLLSSEEPSLTLHTLESLSIALEIPVETLLSPNPTNVDLRIFPRHSQKSA